MPKMSIQRVRAMRKRQAADLKKRQARAKAAKEKREKAKADKAKAKKAEAKKAPAPKKKAATKKAPTKKEAVKRREPVKAAPPKREPIKRGAPEIRQTGGPAPRQRPSLEQQVGDAQGQFEQERLAAESRMGEAGDLAQQVDAAQQTGTPEYSLKQTEAQQDLSARSQREAARQARKMRRDGKATKAPPTQ